MLDFLKQIDSFIWGPPLLVLLVGTGIYLSLRLGFLQVFKLPKALQLIFKSENEGDGDISAFGALATALASTVGTGNIVGVATAIQMGGPGALFWMWMAAFFGMATKYAEGLLAVKYRTINDEGKVSGGPMYYIVQGMGTKWKFLAQFFALSGILVALFGIGTFTQINSITASLQSSFGFDPIIVGAILAVVVAIIIFGGIHKISDVSTKIVPFMAGVYIFLCFWVILANIGQLIPAITIVVKSAFTPTAAIGGFAGATITQALQYGVARGVFSNESGLGSAPIAAAAAKTKWPAEQGLVSMTGTFIDTIIICSLTGISLIITQAWIGSDSGSAMTQAAFGSVMPGVSTIFLTFSLVLFAFTTILGWSYYGERCFEFLFGLKGITFYRLIFVAMVFVGAFLELETVWIISDIVNALMAFPNLIALLTLSPVVVEESRKYFKHLNKD